MRGHTRKRGKTWSYIIDLGEQPAQRCGNCRVKRGKAKDPKGLLFWPTNGAALEECPNCGGLLVETKERRQRWVAGFRTRKDAEAELAKVVGRMDEETYVEPSKQTLAEYLADWLAGVRPPAGGIRYSTWYSYGRNLQNHVIPAIGSKRLRKLQPNDLNKLYADLLDKGLSPRSVHYVHAIIRRALNEALRAGQITRNPAQLARPPKQTRPRMKTWTAEELRQFLRHVRDDILYASYLLAAMTGMRRGELLGLRWDDLDLKAGKLSVRQTLVEVNYELCFSEPKTARGRRVVDLDSATVAALDAHRKRQIEERLAHGPAWRDSGLVFTRQDGSPSHPDGLSDAFKRHVRAAGLQLIRFHDLRHTYATLALDAGMKPWDLSDRLGHASVAFTLDVYRHAIPATQKEAAEKVASLILSG